jgi:ABC-type uncharacterized transport system ATPase subunit
VIPLRSATVAKGTQDRAWVELRGISRRFGAVAANKNIDLDIRRGEVHALLGENGAGKSTLMEILSGVLAPDDGDIYIDGQLTAIDSPKTALTLGVGMVHQQFRLLDALTVAENLFVGWDGTPPISGGRRRLTALAGDLCARFAIQVNPAAYVWQLSVGEKQRVEILRMLVRDVDVLILDEPTAVLTSLETARLFELLRELKREQKAIVFITHKLHEVFQIADSVTVLRDGVKVGEMARGEAEVEALTRLMIGGEIGRTGRGRGAPGEPVLALRRVGARNDHGLTALADVDLVVRAGEVVGVAGVAGNGQRELTEILGGVRPITTGRITIDGRDFSNAKPTKFARASVGNVPEERKGTGLAPGASIWENAILRRYRNAPVSSHGLVSKGIAQEFASSLARSVRLSTTDVELPVSSLSGGNAQRLLVGRELETAGRLLILAYPTRGLDVAAVEDVRAALCEARRRGVGILMVSEDLDEIFELSDRIVVMYGGRIVAEFHADHADRATVGKLLAGVGMPHATELGCRA